MNGYYPSYIIGIYIAQFLLIMQSPIVPLISTICIDDKWCDYIRIYFIYTGKDVVYVIENLKIFEIWIALNWMLCTYVDQIVFNQITYVINYSYAIPDIYIYIYICCLCLLSLHCRNKSHVEKRKKVRLP